jgi:peptidoglycan hydrolase FlgJ
MRELSLIAPPVGPSPLARPAEQVASQGTEAAQQFEQIFLRQLVGSLMQTAKLGGHSQMAGSGVYDSMVVDALASSISAKGGIGLAQLIQQRIDQAGAVRGGTVPGSSEPGAILPLPPNPANGPATIFKIDSSIPGSSRLSPSEDEDLNRMAPRRNR